ncbi:unnamed protein product [Didymodactylos carnosus]|uniref:Uncharacterized protein n=1 Tax=Didymodactylos carnosus TaxID=1234261 RepID=A0A815YH50_9BILA|nr:unnamed protein product [Didymodactylos carnosus]CAF1570000.1 unnamed protein product [Didymodactylos carnosus]CAF3671342.1 unnamed protein product [Didymodactylos carnosus]CAF4433096.1 unnamed protein product [Didymodactylos carnosus]
MKPILKDSVRKLYEMLNSINPSQQHALAGLDEFVTDGVEAWSVLKGMVKKFSIEQDEKKRLQKQISIALLYQKHGYSQHCQEHCQFHCINYALSDPRTKRILE